MVGIYCRTSKNKLKGTDYSIDNQKQEGVKFANKFNEDYIYFVEEGTSGTLNIESRDSFSELISEIKKGTITKVYTIDTSRIDRNSEIWRLFAGTCINSKCKYYPDGEELDLHDSNSMLYANLLSLVNSHYASLTSKKVKLANHSKVLKGKTHGMKPYGFTRDEQNHYKLVDDEVKIVKRIFDLSLQGIGTYSIANILNKEGVPTKFHQFDGEIKRKDPYTRKIQLFQKSNVKWRGNVVHDIIRNPIYKGLRIWNKSNLESKLEIQLPENLIIILPEIWEKVNSNLSANKKNAGKNAQYNYLLNGIIICEHCGDLVIGKKRPKGHDNSYKCKGVRPPYKNCSESRGISLPKLDAFIINFLFHSKELKQLLTEAPKLENEAQKLRVKLKKLDSERDLASRSIEKLAKLLTDPDLNDDLLINEYKKTRARLKANEIEISKISEQINEAENKFRNEHTKNTIESYYKETGFDETKRLVHSLVKEIKLTHVPKFGFRFTISFKNYKEIVTFTTNYKAFDWNWTSRYRENAINDQDRSDDLKIIDVLYDNYSIAIGDIDELISCIKEDTSLEKEQIQDLLRIFDSAFEGYQSIEVKNEVIQISKDDFIDFY